MRSLGLPLVLLLACACPAASTAGQAATDEIGVYFDLAATTQCANLPPGVTTAYLFVLNPSGDVSSLICGIDFTGTVIATSFVGPGGSICDYFPPPVGWNPDLGVCAMWSTPAPAAPAVLAGTIGFFVGDAGSSDILVTPWGQELSICTTTACPAPLTPVSGSIEAPVARINGPCPVPTEPTTWGALKGLYD